MRIEVDGAEEEQQVAGPAPRGSRLGRRLAMVAILAIGAGAASWFYLNHLTSERLDAAVDEANRMDPAGWNLVALLGRRVPVADDRNSARDVEVVLELLPEGWPATEQTAYVPILDEEDGAEGQTVSPEGAPNAEGLAELIESLPPQWQLPETTAQELEAALDPLRQARDHARRLADAGPGWFDIRYAAVPANTDLHHLQECRVVLRLLRLDAALASQRDEPDEAIRSARAMLGVSRALGDEPISLSQVARSSAQEDAIDGLERALAQGEPSSQALMVFQRELEAEALAPLFQIAAEAERAALDELFARLETGELDESALSGDEAVGSRDRLDMDVLRRGLLRFNRALMLKWNNQAVALSRRPFSEWITNHEDVASPGGWPERRFGKSASQMRPAYGSIARFAARAKSRVLCASAAVAVERYRIDHGAWPPSLEELVPAYLPTMPQDPYRGRPLTYRLANGGLTIYAWGPDGQDDEGRLDGATGGAVGPDEGIRLWDADRRRQLPGPVDGPTLKIVPVDRPAAMSPMRGRRD